MPKEKSNCENWLWMNSEQLIWSSPGKRDGMKLKSNWSQFDWRLNDAANVWLIWRIANNILIINGINEISGLFWFNPALFNWNWIEEIHFIPLNWKQAGIKQNRKLIIITVIWDYSFWIMKHQLNIINEMSVRMELII